MDANSYLNNINRSIGDNMRFARQFQATHQQTASTQSSPQEDPLMAMLSPLIMLMLFQMLGQMPPQNGPGQPAGPPYPGMPDPVVNNSVPLQNPAYQYINNLLTGQGNAQTANSVNFSDNISLQRRMDDILNANSNPAIFDLTNRLKTLSPTSDEAIQIHAQIDTQLRQEGRSDSEIQEYDLLWRVAQDNHRLQELSIVAVGNPSPDTTNTIEQLKQDRTEAAYQWVQTFGGAANPDTAAATDLTASVRNALHQGQFSEAQLGQSLKYMLDKAPDGLADQASSLLSDLMESGDININPFLTSDYLDRLSPERRQTLLNAVESSGLRMADGKPNNRFIGFMLEQLARPGDSSTKRLLQQFLQDFYAAYGDDPSTPVGDTLATILKLAGVQADQNKQLVFS